MNDQPERRVEVSLRTVAMYCGERCRAEFVWLDDDPSKGHLPTSRLIVTAWGADERQADSMALEFATQIRDALSGVLKSLSPTDQGDT